MIFDRITISPDKTTEEQMRLIKSWADNLIDVLIMQNNQIEKLQKRIEDLENQ